MSNHRNGSKGGFEPGLTRLRVRHSTTALPQYRLRFISCKCSIDRQQSGSKYANIEAVSAYVATMKYC